MIAKPMFRVYEPTDRAKCLRLFDENCPEFFAPNEREDYSDFLAHDSKDYVVVSSEEKILAAYGLHPLAGNAAALHWILLSRSLQGQGLGSLIMSRVLSQMRDSDRSPLYISASHKSAPFFSRFGAIEISREPDGWGPGMHRVEMRIS
jgi:N-acetylglutamate synthase-like GNAT family acetyltransferase